MNDTLLPGRPYPLGAKATSQGTNFALYSEQATGVQVCLFDDAGNQTNCVDLRERTAFVCDVGSHPDKLAELFPQHDFSRLKPRWWHDDVESEGETIARAEEFRASMNGQDHETTLLVSHWGFILALTGVSVTNGEFLDYDLGTPRPERVSWRP